MAETSEKNGPRGCRGPKVVIVGGGIMGLSLALMLERFDIDYTVLEARDVIAPQIGAGVAIFPNAYRILDQLGLYEQFASTSIPLERIADWWADGSPNAANEGVSSTFERVFGYPLVVMDRQQAIKNIYDKFQDKSKIHSGKTIITVDTSDDGVTLTLNGGEVVTGDLLVGADGVHSFVRSEMWRLGNARQPGCFKGEGPDSIKCKWMALFGIAELKGLKIQPGASLTAQKDQTIAIMSGKDRAYIVHNTVLPKELAGSEIRRFTEEERTEHAEKHFNDLIQNETKFGDLYRNRVRSAYVPLQQYALENWHFGRIILLGDTVHKTHPVTGMGAAMCIEDAAVFVNLLAAHLDTSLPLGPEHVEQMFSELERLRVPRSTAIVNQSFQAQSMQSWQHPLMKLFYMYVIPKLGLDFVLAQAMKGNCAAPRLERLPVPDRRALVGFNDLNPEPIDPVRLLFKWGAFGALLLSTFTTVIFGQAIPSLPGLTVAPDHINGLLIVMLVEGWRRNNALSLLQWPVAWAVLGDFLFGWKRTIPLFLLATYFTHSLNGRFQYTAPNRPMVLSAASVIPIAIIFANAVPSPLRPLATIATLSVSVSSLIWTDRSIPCVNEGADLLAHVSAFFEHHAVYLCVLYTVAFAGLTSLHLSYVGSGFQLWSSAAVLSTIGHYLADLAFLIGTVSEVCFYTGLGRWASVYAAMVTVGLVYLGPGSAYVAVWFWRERRMARTDKHRDQEEVVRPSEGVMASL
ncbi:FAD-dependent monooxygenase andE [Apiospora kogelbergensis]|uniref:FAD-dependent monooxygenase andE n=1 Tax=Apiospora kogelbergensis TaxID=1337665 RepID=A0AAW0R791_9PEZI